METGSGNRDAPAGRKGPAKGGRFTRLLRMLAFAIVALALAAAAILFVRGKDWQAAEHARNYRALDTVGQTLERWPVAVEGLARTNFLPERLTVHPDPLHRDRGFHIAAELFHPEQGVVRIGYELDRAAVCPRDGALDRGPDNRYRRIDRFGSRPTLRLMGELPLSELWYDDQATVQPLGAIAQFTKGDAEKLLVAHIGKKQETKPDKTLPDKDLTARERANDGFWRRAESIGLDLDVLAEQRKSGCTVLNFTVEHPIAAIANLPANASVMDSVMIIDTGNRVIAQLGGRSLPVLGVEDILPLSSRASGDGNEGLNKVLFAAIAAMAQPSNEQGAQKEEAERRARNEAIQRALRAGRPLSVTVAGEDYIAYFRPVRFAGHWTLRDCQPQADLVRDQAGARNPDKVKDGSQQTEQTGVIARKDACLLVGLVRAEDVRSRALDLSADIVMLVALLLMIAVLLVPVGKLRTLGAGGDMRRIEVAAAVFGLVAAAALITLLALISFDLVRAHARSEAALAATADALAQDFEGERSAILSVPLRLPPESRNAGGYPAISPAIAMPKDTCRFADGASTGARTFYQAQEWQHVALHPELKDRFRTGEPWPLRETVGLYGHLGRAFPGWSLVANRCHAGARARIEERTYFRQAMDGTLHGRLPDAACSALTGGIHVSQRYSIGAVRSQGDGVAKLVFAIPFGVGENVRPLGGELKLCGLVPAGASGRVADGPDHGVVLITAVSRALLAPTLPPGQRFIVVDASDPKLPYLFGTDPSRIGIEALSRAIAANGIQAIRTAYRLGGGAESSTLGFTAEFAGQTHGFAARRLEGTPWVLLVHTPVAGLTQPVAEAALLAAFAWFGMALVAAAMLAGYAAVQQQRPLLRLWPRPGSARQARAAAILVGLASAAAVLLLLAIAWAGGHGLKQQQVWIAPLLALAAWALSALLLSGRWQPKGSAARYLMGDRQAPAEPPRALVPADERAHYWLMAMLLLAFGTVPMLATWGAARHSTDMRLIDREVTHYEGAWKAHGKAMREQMQVMGLNHITKTTPVIAPKALVGPAMPGALGLSSQPSPFQQHKVSGGPISWLSSSSGFGATRDVIWSCRSPSAAAEDAGLPVRFCLPGLETAEDREAPMIALVDPLRLAPVPGVWSRVEGWAIVGAALGLFALVIVMVGNVRGFARALFGFGIPLEAVDHPKIRRDRNGLKLAPRSVVLNGQVGIRDELVKSGRLLDVGQPGAALVAAPRATEGEAGQNSSQAEGPLESCLKDIDGDRTIVVMGLDIALKVPALRVPALAALELLSDAVETKKRGRIVVMTDLSPLDRILQAYEREHSSEDGSQPVSRAEQMRWSRLFEDFTTYSLERMPKYHWERSSEAVWRRTLAAHEIFRERWNALKPDQQTGVETLLEEVRDLPLQVIESLVGRPILGLRSDKTKEQSWEALATEEYPVGTDALERHILGPVLEWALVVAPATPVAAIDYLRGQLIEHYQHLWAASSHAERVLLDSLAHDRLVNIKAALAMRSLIRRGMVRMAPAPMLMNSSFKAFVLQAERPESIDQWKHGLPEGGWDRASKYVAVLVPAAILLLIALGWATGIGLERLLPLLLGIGPALFATGTGWRRA